jgi:predicted transcriptional regulator
MSAASQAHKFMVWRTYHQIKGEIGRAPTQQEIAEGVGMSQPIVSYWLRGLKTCGPTLGHDSELQKQRVSEIATRVPDIVTMLGAS